MPTYFENNLVFESSDRNESVQRALSLVKLKEQVVICTIRKDHVSMQAEEVTSVAEMLKGKSSLDKLTSKEKEIVNRWKTVFDNKNSLGLSFRKNKTMSRNFLQSSSEIDHDVLGSLIKICNESEILRTTLTKSLVIQINNVVCCDWNRMEEKFRRENTNRNSD